MADTNFTIEMSYDKDFTDVYTRLEEKYGSTMFDVEGISKKALDRANFAKTFFSNSVTADSSVDPNSNVDDHSTISYTFESGKAVNKLNSLYLIWKTIKKSDGLEKANDIFEKILCGDLYVHDLHGVEAGKPYCVSGDTRILTSNGYVPIASMSPEEPEYLSAVISEDCKNLTVSQFHTKPRQELYELTTRYGFRIKATEDHRFMTPDGYKRLADLEPEKDNVLISIPEISPESDYKTVIINESTVPVTETVAAFIAYFAVEGTIMEYPVFRTYDLDPDIQHQIISAMKEMLGYLGIADTCVEIEKPKPAVSKITVHSDDFSALLQALGIPVGPNNRYSLQVPKELFTGPASVSLEYIRWVFGNSPTTGKFDRLRIRADGKNEQYMQDMQLLCAQHGLLVALERGAQILRMGITGDSRKKFLEEVKLPSERRQKAANRTVNEESTNGMFARTDVEFKETPDGTFIQAPVKSIKKLPGLHTVYDIGVDNMHMFVGNGFVVHNCFNYSTYDIMTEGLSMVNKIKSVPPKHLYAFKSQLEQFTVVAANSTLGE